MTSKSKIAGARSDHHDDRRRDPPAARCDALRGALGTAKDDTPRAIASDWRAEWPALAELGIAGFCVPEEKGGFGLRVDAAVATAMELAEALHGCPYAGLTAGAHALAAAADPVAGELLAGVVAGDLVCAFGRLGPDAFVGANAVQLERQFQDQVTLAATARLPDGTAAIIHEDAQAQLAHARARVQEVQLVVRDTVDRILVDDEHPSDGPVAKLAYSELNVALCELALELIASSTSIDPDGAEVADRWHHNFLWSRALTISGGTSEILRGLIGRQLLGLPRA